MCRIQPLSGLGENHPGVRLAFSLFFRTGLAVANADLIGKVYQNDQSKKPESAARNGKAAVNTHAVQTLRDNWGLWCAAAYGLRVSSAPLSWSSERPAIFNKFQSQTLPGDSIEMNPNGRDDSAVEIRRRARILFFSTGI